MLSLIIIIVYLAILLWIGRLGYVGFARHTAGDYFIASRSFGPFLLIMSIFGTTMTAFALVGSTGEAFTHGIGVYGLMASWSGLIHSACFFLIGVKLWSYGHRFNFTTQIQFFRDRFQSPAVGTLLFPVLVGLVIPYVLIGIVASGTTIERVTIGALPTVFPATRGGIPDWLGAAVICGVVLVYVFAGGVRSTTWVNVIQTSVFLVFAVIALFFISGMLGGPLAASQRVAQLRPDLLVRGAADGHHAHIGHLQFLSYMFVPLSVAMFPHLFQHWMTARSAKAFRAAVILHPVFIMVVWLPCVLVGIWASSAVLGGKPIIPPDADPNSVLGRMVNALNNQYMSGFLTVGLVAAIMSSLDSQFFAIGTMFTHDVVLHHWGEERFSDRQRILIGRVFVVVIVVVSYLISLAKPGSIFTLGVWCFSGFASLFPLVFAALYWKRTTAAGAMASILTAVASLAAIVFLATWTGKDETELLYGIMPVAAMCPASAAALVAVSLMTKQPAQSVLDRYFPAANKTVAPAPIPASAPMPVAREAMT